MAVLQTGQKFLQKAVAKYGDKYDFSKVVYSGFKGVVVVICNKHAIEFEAFAWKFLAGTGCPTCGIEGRKEKNSDTQEDFIAKAKSVHGKTYDYSEVVYEKSTDVVSIECSIHGIFKQKAGAHILGKGCRTCAFDKVSSLKRLTVNQFTDKAETVHGSTYSYDKVVYVNNCTDVVITCKMHGDFKQKPIGHLTGNGCTRCMKTGYRTNVPGSLYILSCGDITKVGITNLDPLTRVRDISRSYGRKFTLENSWSFDDGTIADSLENTILTLLKSQYNQPLAKFDGYTECFLDVDMRLLTNEIESQVKAYY